MNATIHNDNFGFRSIADWMPRSWQAALKTNAECDNRPIRIPTDTGKAKGVLVAWLDHRVRSAFEVRPAFQPETPSQPGKADVRSAFQPDTHEDGRSASSGWPGWPGWPASQPGKADVRPRPDYRIPMDQAVEGERIKAVPHASPTEPRALPDDHRPLGRCDATFRCSIHSGCPGGITNT